LNPRPLTSFLSIHKYAIFYVQYKYRTTEKHETKQREVTFALKRGDKYRFVDPSSSGFSTPLLFLSSTP
jgi:outer membrane protein assembly factor BamA